MASAVKTGRNDACSCGSGKKFKKCCEPAQQRSRGAMLMFLLIGVLMAAGLMAALSSFTTDTRDVGKASGVWSPEHGHYH